MRRAARRMEGLARIAGCGPFGLVLKAVTGLLQLRADVKGFMRACPWYLAAAALLACVPTRAADLLTEPILRIEAGSHTAPIWRIATDAQGRIAVTTSQDKTARVSACAAAARLTHL